MVRSEGVDACCGSCHDAVDGILVEHAAVVAVDVTAGLPIEGYTAVILGRHCLIFVPVGA